MEVVLLLPTRLANVRELGIFLAVYEASKPDVFTSQTSEIESTKTGQTVMFS